jgi:hypothetical protein
MIDVKRKDSKKKIRVNITVDKEVLDKAKTKLHLFGGKVSTLFNAYLADFVESMDKKVEGTHKEIIAKLDEMEKRIEKVEKDKNRKIG